MFVEIPNGLGFPIKYRSRTHRHTARRGRRPFGEYVKCA